MLNMAEKTLSLAELFGKRLEELLKEKNLTHEQFAEEIYVSTNTIGNWCRGKTSPSIDSVKQIAKYFDVSTDYLLEHCLNVPISELANLFEGSLKRKSGIRITMKATNAFMMLYCSRPLGKSELYPKSAVSTAEDSDYVEEDSYAVTNGNIYRTTKILRGDTPVENVRYSWKSDVSIYDYVNKGNRIKQFVNAYKAERHTLGLIGALSADEFYLLCYILGYHEKKRQSENV